jgi:hypothetical protein
LPHGARRSSTGTSSRPASNPPHLPARSSNGAELLAKSAVSAGAALRVYVLPSAWPAREDASAMVAMIADGTIGSHTFRLGW